MGIPSFFKHIVTRYGDSLIEPLKKNHCDRLFIDFNCILHKFANELSQKYTHIPLSKLEEMIMEESIDYVKMIYKIISPLELLFVAIDGVCPHAKMIQQRKRRYISSWKKRLVENDENYQKDVNMSWNSNCITPGTTFMNTFNNIIKKAFNNDEKVVISGSDEFGEGEHKIYNFIKSSPLKNMGKNEIIYGLDADLILLSLLNIRENSSIRLMRESDEILGKKSYNMLNNDFLFLNINNLKERLYEFYFQGQEKNCYNVNAFTKDYVILCSFLGNDFIPPLSYIKVKNNGIDFVIDEYQKVKEKTCQNIIDDNGQINHMFLKMLLRNMSKYEDENMKVAHQNYLQRRIPQTHTHSYHRILFAVDNYPSSNKIDKEMIDCSKKNWRVQYYQALFHGDMVNEICKNYAEGLKWIADYYILQNPLFDWYYKYNYSPTILDLSNYIEFELELTQKKDINQLINIDKNQFLDNSQFQAMMKNGILQLLMVLPPCSNYLIPNQKIKSLMTNASQGCLHYFPTHFKISTFLKQYIWECSAILPDIDIKYLHFMSQF